MGRTPENRLTLEPLPSGKWALRGYILGERIRKRGELADLEAIKAAKEAQFAAAQAHREALRMTWLTPDQLRDAEAAVGKAGGRSLLDSVIASSGHMPDGQAVECVTALNDWEEWLEARKRSPRTVSKNRLRVAAFFDSLPAGVRYLHEITPAMIDAHVYRKGGADYSRLSDAQVLRAFFAWCSRPPKRIGQSPFAVDMRDLARSARPVEAPRILTAAQCWALLKEAQAHRGGALASYVILSTWCFMRPSEVVRTTAEQLKLDGADPVVEVWPRKRGTPSYRTVKVPACVLPALKAAGPVRYSKTMWESVRAKAGLVTLSKAGRHKRRTIEGGDWQHDILRHTGISYHFAQHGDIKETCRQAGNTSDISFRHYLRLPGQGEAAAFYRVTP